MAGTSHSPIATVVRPRSSETEVMRDLLYWNPGDGKYLRKASLLRCGEMPSDVDYRP